MKEAAVAGSMTKEVAEAPEAELRVKVWIEESPK